MEPGAVVTITLREVYDAVVRLTGRVDVMIAQQEHSKAVDADHESRLRVLERARWPLPSLAVLCSLAALAVTLLGRFS